MAEMLEEVRLLAVNQTSDRIFQLKSGDLDEEKRQLCLTFSSDTPVERDWGFEILSHDPLSADLNRMKERGAFLLNHSIKKQIGAVIECTIQDGKGKAIVQFSRSRLAQEIFEDIKDGLRPNVSFRYRILDLEKTDGARKRNKDTYVITKYEVLEISSVSIPADVSVGVGRSLILENTTKDKDKSMAEPRIETTGSIDTSALIASERGRIAEISEAAKLYGKEELAKRYIDEGRSVNDFKLEILKNMRTDPVDTQDMRPRGMIDIGQKEARGFSFSKAILAQATGDWSKAGLEKEVISETRSKISKADSSVLYIPMNVLQRNTKDGMKATKEGYGAEFVAEELRSSSFIDALRDRLIVRQLGAKFLTDLSGDLAIPKQTGKTSAYWVAEGEAVKRSDATTGKIVLKPRTVSAMTDYTRKLLIQSSIDIENFIKDDIAQQIALAIDSAAIVGAENGPTGIIKGGALKVTTGGAALQYSHIVELETKIAEANADIGTMAYVCGAKLRGKLKTTEMSPSTAKYLWTVSESGIEMMNGYRAFCSNLCPVKGTGAKQVATLIFGAWDQLIVGSFGVLGITVDPYTLASESSIRIIATQEVDVAIRNPESFAYIEDASVVAGTPDA